MDHECCLFACHFDGFSKDALLQAMSSALWRSSSATEAPAPAAAAAADGVEGPSSQQDLMMPWTPMRSMAGLQPRALGLKRDRDPSPGGEHSAHGCYVSSYDRLA